MARQEDEMKKQQEEFEKTKEELAKISKQKKELEEQNSVLTQAKNDLSLQLQAEQDNMADMEERIAQLVNQRGDYEEQVRNFIIIWIFYKNIWHNFINTLRHIVKYSVKWKFFA